MTTTSPPTERAPFKFTGRERHRKTSRSVKVIDRAAKYIICIGGIGVTIAFLAIVLFLGWTVVPLFQAPQVETLVAAQLPSRLPEAPADAAGAAATTAPTTAPTTRPGARSIGMGLDETLATLWLLDDTGELYTYRTSGGELVTREQVLDKPITAFANEHGVIAVGHADGTVRIGQITQEVEFLPANALPDAAESLEPGDTIAYEGKVGTLTPGGQLRTLRTVCDLSEPLAVGDSPSPIRRVDYLKEGTFEKLVVLRDDGRLFLATVSKRTNMLTGAVKRSIQTQELPRPPRVEGKTAAGLLLGLGGRQLYVAYTDGWTARYNLDDQANPIIAEERSLLPSPERSVSSVKMLLGRYTLIVGDSGGGVSGWFPVAGNETPGRDGLRLVEAHELRSSGTAITDIEISARDRQFLTVSADGHVVLRHMTSGTTQHEIEMPEGTEVRRIQLAPKNDAIAILDTDRKLTLHSLHNPHADGSLAQMFMPLHYEGYPRPAYIYQSSAGTQDAELKISLVPLIFGTLKATVYAMLFAVPIAILAAIYTSEFMQPEVRSVVKPTVELMASLPSVVLGYIGALVLAQWVESAVAAVLLMFIAVPLGVIAFGFLWQMLPPSISTGTPAGLKFAVMCLVVLLSLWVSYIIGPGVEHLVFGRGLSDWLAGGGSAAPGWAIALAPLIGVGLTLLFNLYVKPRMAMYHRRTDRLALGLVELGRFVAILALTVGLASLLGWVLAAVGLDLRGNVVGPYVQRNSLMVGMMMGFAIIPIIYTVSEDALSSVPSSLRSASLGAGATPWQTALRIVLPVAMSGIFSACMIGFGRAAGETMIVLMLSGRTPILDINVFNGLSALSANIATEMPEAPVNSTHYRMLFMSTLVLFAMTFVVNTAAEIVRLRFRKRAYQL